MGRSRRILYPNAFYHVMNRGGARRAIYENDNQRLLFLALLEECSTKFSCEVHAYCLMDNHFHLLIRTPNANLSDAMHWITNQYSRKVNKSLRLDGSIFRGRFKAVVVDADNYLVHVSRYIHLNPVKAKLCSHPLEFAWSSYAGYVNEKVRPLWLHTDEVMRRLGPAPDARNYALLVENPTLPSLDDFFRRPGSHHILGSKQFQKYLLSTITESHLKSLVVPDTAERSQRFHRILEVTAAYAKANPADLLASVQGKALWARSAAIYLCKKHCSSNNSEIAAWFKIGLPAVSMSLSRFTVQLQNESDLQARMEAIEDLLLTAR